MTQTDDIYRKWRHAPSHLFSPSSAYMITAGTHRKTCLFDTPQKRDMLTSLLLSELDSHGWALQAWAVMSNHYHVVAHAPADANSLARVIRRIHSKSAVALNEVDQVPGRRVWFQYYDTCLTNERSYWARLHYVHENPAKHGVVQFAEEYPWCSMSWFRENADSSLKNRVLSFPCDKVSVVDSF